MKPVVSRPAFAGMGALGVTLVVMAGFVVGTGSSETSAKPPRPDFELRGTSIDVDRFSLTTLHDAAILDAIEDARVGVFDDCMADRGFLESPTADPDAGLDEYTLAFESAAYGPDAWEIGPPLVRLPDGSATRDGVVWQPGSCAYNQDDTFGVDPYLREALRYRVMILRLEADQVTIADPTFGEHFDAWQECSGSTDAIALLEALDPASATTGDIRLGRRTGSAERQCVTGEMRSDLLEIRGFHHARSVEENLAIVAGWVDLIDAQAKSVAPGTE